ncbi:hypothetical protein PV379_00120 [Streptomyces caniscabiei]|uniref:hypothetical protein n=1 Tax=Streptomyces caniscabiei TaxID=2746961 RepID=UPI0029B54D5B|nr:hypothetical protein [Streptomyces caniscabiei]MDX2775764.1 hypothetical protein [Streptomyces caniscabiei]
MAKKRKNTAQDTRQHTTAEVVERRQVSGSWLRRRFEAAKKRMSGFLSRRPHRSFRRTYRRDYVRSLELPGYWAFTNYVQKTLLGHKAAFLWLVAFYGTLSVVMVGLASQDTYLTFTDTLREAGGELFTGGWGEIGRASVLLLTGVTGAWSGSLTEIQQVYVVLIGLLTWLTAVWLLRAYLADGNPRFRDGLYNAGAPIVPTFIVALAIIVQLMPVALAAAGLSAAIASGLIDGGGVEAMLFWMVIVALSALSLYWMTSTLIALVVVTLPGMYPFKAIKTAGDLVVGRRIRILLRLLWMALMLAVAWLVIMVPIILFDAWLKAVIPAIDWMPVVPMVMVIMSSASVVWIASYVYLLYRKVVDDDAAPA